MIRRPPRSPLFPSTPLFRSSPPPSPLRRASAAAIRPSAPSRRSEEHTSELQSHDNLVCRLLLEKKKKHQTTYYCSSAISHRQRVTTTRAADVCGLCLSLSLTYSVYVLPFTLCLFFFFNDTATTEIYTLSLHDALPIWGRSRISAPPTTGGSGWLATTL